MTLIIAGYSPVNIVMVNGVLRSQYIIPTNDIDAFLSDQAKTQGLVGFEGCAFIFEGITLDIKRKTITEVTITVTYSSTDIIEHYGVKGMKWGSVRRARRKADKFNSLLNVDTLLNLMEEQDGSN